MSKPKYSAQEMVGLDKDVVRKMEGLLNLKDVLNLGFSKIGDQKIEHGIIVIGDTGCGKSTLLSALVNGSDSLEEREVDKEIPIKKGGKVVGTKMTKQKVIDYKPSEVNRVFPIGHKMQSETFLPSF